MMIRGRRVFPSAVYSWIRSAQLIWKTNQSEQILPEEIARFKRWLSVEPSPTSYPFQNLGSTIIDGIIAQLLVENKKIQNANIKFKKPTVATRVLESTETRQAHMVERAQYHIQQWMIRAFHTYFASAS